MRYCKDKHKVEKCGCKWGEERVRVLVIPLTLKHLQVTH